MARTKSPARKPSRRYHHGNLRRALLDEALAMIRTEGVEGLTLREIGTRLGVSRTALYRHFADKRALIEAVATEGFRTLREALIAGWEGPGRGLPGFDQMGVAYVRFAVGNPSHYRVMFGRFLEPGGRDPALAIEAAGAFDALLDAIVALQQEGLVRNDEPMTQARFVWGLVHGVAMLAIDGQLREPGAIDTLTRYALDRLTVAVATGREDAPR